MTLPQAEFIFARLPPRTRTLLALPEKERAKLIRERKKLPSKRKKVERA